MLRWVYFLIFSLGTYQLLASFDPTLSSLCSINEMFNCQSVFQSSYSKILGVPLAFLVILFGLFGFLRSKQKDVSLLILNSLGIIATTYSLVVMTFVLKTFCITCLIVDVLLVLSFYLTIRRPTIVLMPGILKDALTAVGVALMFLLVIYMHSHPKNFVEGEKITMLSSNLILGNKEGTKEVTVFTDFQCPACMKGSEVIKYLIKKDPLVRVAVKNYPLSNQCNAGVSQNLHPWACEAALLSYCAQEQGKFEEFYTLIYSIQDQIKKKEDIYELLQVGSFNIEEMKSCAQSDSAMDFIKKDMNEANKINIQGTPTFFYQGQKVPLWSNPYLWEEFLNSSM